MLGHLKPTLCGLSENGKAQYWQFYCSVCSSLRSQNNLAYSFLLNNEMTLLLAAFQSFIEKEAQQTKTSCPAKAYLSKNPTYSHKAIETAAKLSVLLGWIKILDWQTDKPRFYKKILVLKLNKKTKKIIPHLAEDSQKILNDYVAITKNNETNFQIIQEQSNILSKMLVKEIAAQIQNIENEEIIFIQNIFGKAGELIAIADHLIDLEKDIIGKQYNPIISYSEQKNTSLAEEYIKLRIEYNRLIYAIKELLPKTHQNFSEMMLASLHTLNNEVKKNTPQFMQAPETMEIVGRLQIAKSDFMGLGIASQTASDCCDSGCGEVCASICVSMACQACFQTCCNSLCDSDRRRNSSYNTNSNNTNNNNNPNYDPNNNPDNPYYDPNNPNNNSNNNSNNNQNNRRNNRQGGCCC
jgi:hypothetical protein